MNAVVATIPAPANALPAPSESAFALAQRQAKALSASDLVPQAYRNNLPNTLLALEIANRIGASPFAVMQNLYIVQGRPSWSSSFLIATVNACGRFEPLRFEVAGSDPAAKDYRVRAVTRDKASGEVCAGAWITWKMVDAEGWSKKSGSKWMTMPEQMFMYRAAGFWARVYAPEISLGILTTEEAKDVWGGPEPVQPAAATDHSSLRVLEAQLTGAEPPASEPEPITADSVRARFEQAQTVDELNDAFDLIDQVPADQRGQLATAYELARDRIDIAAK